MTAEEFVSRLNKVKQVGDGHWMACCPAHADKTPSLSITQSPTGNILLKDFGGCSIKSIVAAVGVEMSDLFSEPKNGHDNESIKKEIVATYKYTDEDGNYLYEKVRYIPKDFRMRKPDPNKKGGWDWSVPKESRVLYNLQTLLEAIREGREVFFVEGEKDVETMRANGFVATCNNNGAEEKWLPQYTKAFTGANLIFIRDKDTPGRTLCKTVEEAVKPIVRSFRSFEMPNRRGKRVKDVTDWFEAGGTLVEFEEIVKSPPEDPTQQIWQLKDLIAYDTNNDKNCVIGFHDGKTTRYLDQGCGMFQIGQSGIGKSTLMIQQGCQWALGRPFFGINPVRPLRILLVQSENDQGDCAETIQGMTDMLHINPQDFDELNSRFRIIRCRGRTGADFCKWLMEQCFIFQADLVYVDPLLRFAGIDVSRQDQCTRFLNEQMDPMLAETKAVVIGAHHTGKPKSAKETAGWTIYDHAYSGIGSSELVNWARAISILKLRDESDGTFELLLAKRGARAWAHHPVKEEENKAFTTTIYLRHSKTHVFWEQLAPEDLIPDELPEEKKTSAKRSKSQEIASSNLFEFCSGCTDEGESLNDIARRMEKHFAGNRVDYSYSTCRRAVAELVANGKLTKTDNQLYIKGPNA